MKKLLYILVVALLCGCGTSPDLKVYVEADRLTYEAIQEEYLSLLEKSDLDPAQKKRRQRLITSWRKRIEGAEESLKGGE